MEDRVEVLVVSRQRLVAEALAHAIESLAPDLKVVGVLSAWDRVVASSHRASRLVVLVDAELVEEISQEAARSLSSRAVMVLMGDHESEEVLITAVEAEWRGYVDKELALGELLSVIRRTIAGEVVMPAHLLYRAIQSRSVRSRTIKGARVDQLTAREREVLALISQGLDNKSIAAALGIRVTTARSHVQRVLEKLGVHSKLQAVQFAGMARSRRPLRGNPRTNAVA